MTGVTRTGSPGAPALVFLHGGVINRHMWIPVCEALGRDYDCIAIDLPGHGDRRDQVFKVDSAVHAIEDALDAFGVPAAAMVGLSLGGYIAQAMAAAHREKVTGLVLSGATIRYTGWDGLSTKLYGYAFPLLARPATKAFASKLRSDVEPRVADAILAGGLSMKGGGRSLRTLPGKDYAAEMVGFDRPIILANGERDSENRAAEKVFMEHHPHAISVVIEDAGHACALQQPTAFAEAVRKLGSVRRV